MLPEERTFAPCPLAGPPVVLFSNVDRAMIKDAEEGSINLEQRFPVKKTMLEVMHRLQKWLVGRAGILS